MDERYPYSQPTRPEDLAGCETEPCPLCGHPMTAILAGLAPLRLTCRYCGIEITPGRPAPQPSGGTAERPPLVTP
jgi:hypothetical protein